MLPDRTATNECPVCQRLLVEHSPEQYEECEARFNRKVFEKMREEGHGDLVDKIM